MIIWKVGLSTRTCSENYYFGSFLCRMVGTPRNPKPCSPNTFMIPKILPENDTPVFGLSNFGLYFLTLSSLCGDIARARPRLTGGDSLDSIPFSNNKKRWIKRKHCNKKTPNTRKYENNFHRDTINKITEFCFSKVAPPCNSPCTPVRFKIEYCGLGLCISVGLRPFSKYQLFHNKYITLPHASAFGLTSE